jgi:4-amino-4-deoxy-L-arabinose transferase-like glycosyltransferase
MTGFSSAVERGWLWASAQPIRARCILVGLCLLLFLPWFASFPVTDRDEALFAQSSRQMAETGDILRIRFLDEARNKKPVGIYWLQAAAVTLTTGPAGGAIWPYRLPSLIGAILAVLLTHAIALRLMPREAALGAGAILAASFVLAGEARLAKTDAMLLATTLGSMAVLVRAWICRPDRLSLAARVQFWGCLAAAVLLKGPIGPLVVLLTLLALGGFERRWGWAAVLARGGGPLIFAALVAPWFVAITLLEGWSFWQASVGRDLLGKVAAGQESHGLPPGSHAVALALSFWPGSALLLLALPKLRGAFANPTTRLALAWVVPFWLVLELTPTKLLHYPLPVFPVLAMLAAERLFSGTSVGRGWVLASMALALAGLGVPAALFGLATIHGEIGRSVPLLFVGSLLCLAAFVGALFVDRRTFALVSILGLAATTHLATLTIAAQTHWLWPTAAIPRQIAALQPCPDSKLSVAGFLEPSIAFLSPIPVTFTDGEGVARALDANPCAIGLVDQKLLPDLVTTGVFEFGTPITGFAIGSGREVSLVLVHRSHAVSVHW